MSVAPVHPFPVGREYMTLGSASVCEDDRVVGVFTMVDALRALHGRLFDAAVAWDTGVVRPKDKGGRADAASIALMVAPSHEAIGLRLGGTF
jgi:CBS domain-containing protein